MLQFASRARQVFRPSTNQNKQHKINMLNIYLRCGTENESMLGNRTPFPKPTRLTGSCHTVTNAAKFLDKRNKQRVIISSRNSPPATQENTFLRACP